MTRTFKSFGFPMIFRNAEGGGSGGGEGGNESNGNVEPESVLFPNEGKDDEEDGNSGNEANAGKEGGEGNSDWQEYKPDPNKTDEENAAAKAEHDKTKPADDGKGKKSDDPLDAVPEDGKYSLTMPEGVEVDKELLDALSPRLKAKGYTHREAQELADEFIKVQTEQHKTRMKEWGETVSGWVDEAKADKEIGGTKFDGTVKNAQRFLTVHGTPELREYLNASGGGNHPELIRVFAKAGAMIREDNPAAGGVEGNSKPVDAAHALFPTDAPKG